MEKSSASLIQMKEIVILVADPEIPGSVTGHTMHDSAKYAAYGNKPAILEIGTPPAVETQIRPRSS